MLGPPAYYDNDLQKCLFSVTCWTNTWYWFVFQFLYSGFSHFSVCFFYGRNFFNSINTTSLGPCWLKPPSREAIVASRSQYPIVTSLRLSTLGLRWVFPYCWDCSTSDGNLSTWSDVVRSALKYKSKAEKNIRYPIWGRRQIAERHPLNSRSWWLSGLKRPTKE